MSSKQTVDFSTWSMVKRLTKTYLHAHVKSILIAFCFMFLSAFMTAIFAWLMEPLFDHVLVGKRTNFIVPMAFAIFICFLIRGMAAYGHTLIISRIGQYIIADIQRDLFTNLLDLDLAFFHSNASGQLVSRLINDVNAMRGAVSDTLAAIGLNVMTLIFLVGLMFHQDWQLALISLFIFPIVAVFLSQIGRRLRKASKKIQAETGSLTALLIQIFQGVRQVKAYGTEKFEQGRSGQAISTVRDLNIKAIRIATLAAPISEVLLGLAIMVLVICGGLQVTMDILSVGALTSFITAFALAYEPMRRLGKLNNTLQIGLGAGERIFEAIDMKAKIIDKPEAVDFNVKKPEIIFENVSFSYGLDDGEALKNVSFKIESGQVTALVGPSGSGKTTAMNLVARFYDVSEGRILFDKRDVRDVTIESLRRHIALVSQDVTIFDDTVKANIAYGCPDSSDEDIERAAEAAAANDFILEMPEGYETNLGEQGVKLSGGQRQRIAIARAILRNAPVLLLDEATSALDTESERAIQKSLETLQEGRTVLVIAHRLSTVQNANKIIVLDEGGVAETGDHAELVKAGGLYARMYKAGLEK